MVGRRRTTLVVTTAAVLGTCALGSIALARDGSTRLRANLDGAQEVPPADPDGDGRSRVRIEDGEICFDVRFDDIGTPNRGHIHKAAAGSNGGIVVAFFELVGLPADPRNEDLEEGSLEDCVPVADPVLLADIAANPAAYYVNLHNTRFPAGAIRGQLDD